MRPLPEDIEVFKKWWNGLSDEEKRERTKYVMLQERNLTVNCS